MLYISEHLSHLSSSSSYLAAIFTDGSMPNLFYSTLASSRDLSPISYTFLFLVMSRGTVENHIKEGNPWYAVPKTEADDKIPSGKIRSLYIFARLKWEILMFLNFDDGYKKLRGIISEIHLYVLCL